MCGNNMLVVLFLAFLLDGLALHGLASSSSSSSSSSSASLKTVSEGGVCELADIQVHAVFAVDSSKSMDDRSYNLAMEFVANFTRFVGNVSNRSVEDGLWDG